MRPFTIVIAAALTLFGEGSALADCQSSDQVMPIGAVSGDPENDTFGLACTAAHVEQTALIAAAPRLQTMQVGISTGEAEKDTFGFVQATGPQ
jgi:hypothetical protein